MGFRKTDDIVDDLMAALPSETFRDIRKCNVTSFEQLLSALPELTRLPGAIVVAGPSNFIHGGATRVDEMAIVVVDAFRGTAAAKAANAWDVRDIATGIFPDDGNPLVLNDVYLTLGDTRPLKLPDRTAYIINFKAHQ